jgi:ribosomal protein L24E
MGHWEEIEKPWYEVKIVNCSLCGRMIARRLWVVDKGERHVFCSEKCELRSERMRADRTPD